jgi:16S rRNA (cytosine1402-N4)-methyltransferase
MIASFSNFNSAEALPSAGYHVPVLLREVLEAMSPAEGKTILDCTLGGGGHSEALLEAGARVIGVDQDPAAIEHATERLKRFGARFRAVRSSFGGVAGMLQSMGVMGLDGVLMDLGVSSHQLDTPGRGFSFQAEGPLDMRMDPEGPVRAVDLVNTASGEQLERIFRDYGEEPMARRIAGRIVRDRAVAPLSTTLDLARCVESVVPRRGKSHPATRVFQALRIAVNRELEVLERGLVALQRWLVAGGRFAVITFHSLEDRIVKRFFQEHSTVELDRPEWSAPRPNPECWFRKVTGKPLVASESEQRSNPRARSAKLRVVERLFEEDSKGEPPVSVTTERSRSASKR